MNTPQAALVWLLLVPWVKPAPPAAQSSPTETFGEIWDYEEPPRDGGDMKRNEILTILHDLQKDESTTEQPERAEAGEMPTCLLCVCLSGSVYCEETDIDAVPPLPKETNYLYARFNKIKKITAKDFADIPNLRRLDFTGNLIEDIEDGAFSRLSLLEELTLAENRLLKLPILPAKLTLFNARHNKLKSKGIKANTFKKLKNLSFLYLDHNDLDSVPPHLPESLRILHLQFNNIADITDDTFCKSNDTRYIRSRVDEIRMEGNPILLGKHPNSFICLKRLPTGTYY
ncbi:mimecan isoform X1 [Antechinus flavipes]|uniref:mimecan isoform X1 n=1 Tax=Antechinus flavipes TaxID=38775 RepID=UPI0022355DE8|nr:mimecan isoform X1 [Antechinus flavipes]